MVDETLMPTGPAAQLVPCAPNTLRTYEREGLLMPLRDANGGRLYTMAMVERARAIKAEREARIFRRRAEA